MRGWSVKCLVLAASLMFAAPMSAVAQDAQPGKLGVGLSFLSDEGTGVGFTVDYSKPVRTFANGNTLGWVGDFSFHRDSDETFDIETHVNVLGILGGVRFGGPVGQNSKVSWHGQGLVGLMRFSLGGDLADELCDLGNDCSENRFVFAPGAGIDYAFNSQTALRAQLDFPLGDDVSAVRFWIGISRRIGQ